MKFFYRVILFLLLSTIIIFASDRLPKGKGSFIFNDPGLINGKNMNVYYYIPSNYTDESPVLFVFHGVRRNADEYRDQWNEHAEKYNVLLVVPEFNGALFPLDQDYNMGNVFKMNSQDSILAKNPKSIWAFSVVEPIFQSIKERTGNKSKGYYLYGHSAGSQFVQRFILFLPEANWIKAVSANAGWYTMLQPNTIYPYGLLDTGISESDLAKLLSKKFIVLLGTEDNDPNDKYLRRTPEAMLQGTNRFERGLKFYKEAEDFSEENGFNFNWEMIFVQGVGHSNLRMSERAVEIMFNK